MLNPVISLNFGAYKTPLIAGNPIAVGKGNQQRSLKFKERSETIEKHISELSRVE